MAIAFGRTLTHARDALAWRIRRLVGDQRVDHAIVSIAKIWRPLLHKPVFIGIAGSAGKTTTKELLAGILSHKMRGVANSASLNALPEVAKTVLRLRPNHDFCVAELSEDRPGALDEHLALLQPTVAIVTVVQDDHLAAFASRGAIALEIGKLVAALPATGTAILNADDKRVLAMAAECKGRVITYGLASNADLRAEDISSIWPNRLQLTLVHGSARVEVKTQLCGTHWIPSVLGAIGGGLATGMTLAQCAEGIASVAPFDGRMQPVTTPDGVTFIRDDFKAPLWTLDACFEFMKAARAKRKIIVIGELQEVGPRKGEKYVRTAILARNIADMTIFVGPWASNVLKAHKPGEENALRAFGHVRDASEYINSITREGDLVLLKGANKQDHLVRIILARGEGIACWRDDCERQSFCNECPNRMKPSGAPLLQQRPSTPEATPQTSPSAPSDLCAIEPDVQVVIGLGNPEARYAGTPHNIGHEVVDHIAASLGLTWNATPEALIARGSLQCQQVCLVKVQTAMNLTGTGLKQLSDSLKFSSQQCILVYDDLALPLGSVRTRLSGGAGGHRGVASILEAFQTDKFRRVKVGIGIPGAKLERAEYVLATLDVSNVTAIDQAVLNAAARVIEMVAAHPKAT